MLTTKVSFTLPTLFKCVLRQYRQSSGRSPLPSYYASSAWSGFIKAADRQRVDAFLARCKCVGYCAADLPSFDELLKTADQQLFNKLSNCDTHLLHGLLPPPSIASQNYSLRPRNHNRQLPEHTGHLTDSNFITRLLYLDSY